MFSSAAGGEWAVALAAAPWAVSAPEADPEGTCGSAPEKPCTSLSARGCDSKNCSSHPKCLRLSSKTQLCEFSRADCVSKETRKTPNEYNNFRAHVAFKQTPLRYKHAALCMMCCTMYCFSWSIRCPARDQSDNKPRQTASCRVERKCRRALRATRPCRTRC